MRTRRPQPRRTPPADAGLLPFPRQRGGRRAGAGRPKLATSGVSHRQRQVLSPRHPAHITVKLRQHLPKLRRKAERAALNAAFAAGCAGVARCGRFRLCHYAILNDHLHFVVEAEDRAALSRGLQGLLVRIAKALNKLWRRKGKVFADRYHDRVLQTPREVRNVIRYVLGNGKKHAAEGRELLVGQAVDVFTSAPWFDGFVEHITVRGIEAMPRPVLPPRTWMLTHGWRRHGLLSVHDLPATA